MSLRCFARVLARLAGPLLLLLPGGLVRAQAGPTGTVRGIVQASPTNVRLPYAVVSIPALNIERFSGATGQFLLTEVPVGTHELLVRRIGFVPQQQTITVTPNGTTELTVSLVQVPVRLTGMTVRASGQCREPGLPDSVRYPEVAQLVGLLRENASTYRSLVRRYPFGYVQTRAFGDWFDGTMAVQTVDTIAVSSLPRAQYRPGSVVQQLPGTRELFMAIPTVVDLVDPAFVANHCFTYGGVSQHDGETWFRLDVRAADRLSRPDVHGAFFLDSASAQLRRMELALSRPERLPRAFRHIRAVTVHTTFVEVAPGLSVLHAVCAMNWRRPVRGSTPRHGAELQFTLGWEFVAAPPDVPRVTVRATPSWRPGGTLAGPDVDCAAAEP